MDVVQVTIELEGHGHGGTLRKVSGSGLGVRSREIRTRSNGIVERDMVRNAIGPVDRVSVEIRG